jgi:hypothetical protein
MLDWPARFVAVQQQLQTNNIGVRENEFEEEKRPQNQ